MSSKAALYAAGGAVAVMAAVGPAAAAPSAPAPVPAIKVTSNAPASAPQLDHRGPYWGKVIARTGLRIRTGPSQRFRTVGFLKHGQIVKIRCKVNGQVIDGNPRWYKLWNGEFMWSAARYIKNIGPAPHFCKHRR